MPKSLLLADDSVTIQKVVSITFADQDVDLISVDNGDDAIARAREALPDVILADVVMPGKNGYEVCEAVKSDPELRHIPVLLLSGTFEAFDEDRAARCGANGHVTKPFEAGALVSRVKELMDNPPPPTQLATPPAPAEEPAPAVEAPADDAAFDFLEDEMSAGDTLPPSDVTVVNTQIDSLEDDFDLDSDPGAFDDGALADLGADEPAPPPPPTRPLDATTVHATAPAAGTEDLLGETSDGLGVAADDGFDFEFDGSDDPLAGSSPDLVQETVVTGGADDFDVSDGDLAPTGPASASAPDDPFSAGATVVSSRPLVEGSADDFDFDAPGPLDSAPQAPAFASDPEPASEPALTPEPPLESALTPEPPLEPAPTPEPALTPEPPPAPLAEPAGAEPTPAGAPAAEPLGARPASSARSLSPALEGQLHEALEKVAWEAFGDLSEKVIPKIVEQVEKVAWEVVPQMAEALIREEIRKLKGED